MTLPTKEESEDEIEENTTTNTSIKDACPSPIPIDTTHTKQPLTISKTKMTDTSTTQPLTIFKTKMSTK